MAQRFELQRALSTSSPRGVDRVIASLFVSGSPSVAGAVVVTLPSCVGGRAAERGDVEDGVATRRKSISTETRGPSFEGTSP